MSNYEQLTNELLDAYGRISSNEENMPKWAVHKRNFNKVVLPTIPFVGKNYLKQEKKVLVYASAENLAGYWKGNDNEWTGDWLDDDIQSQNRHRKCFDDPAFQNAPFFPHVHISPLNNGALATAVYYIVSKICRVEYSSPREFYETISFGNYGKFAIETEFQKNIRLYNKKEGDKENTDYTQIKVKEAREKLKFSIPFLKSDIEILKPDILILPKTIYEINKKAFDKISEGITMIPIYQINTGVINRTISKNHLPYRIDNLSESVKKWYAELHQEGITGITKEKYLSVFTYLDSVISECIK